jgi:hypothetical protein
MAKMEKKGKIVRNFRKQKQKQKQKKKRETTKTTAFKISSQTIRKAKPALGSVSGSFEAEVRD